MLAMLWSVAAFAATPSPTFNTSTRIFSPQDLHLTLATIQSTNWTAGRVLVVGADGIATNSVVTSTELGYVSGATSSLQTQISGKASSSHVHAGEDITSGTVADARIAATLSRITGTETLQNKTIDAAANVLKMTGYITLTHPHRGEGVGAVWQTNSVANANFGHVLFSATADQAANYVSYILTVPEDLDTSVDLKVSRWKFKLSGADTGTHRYVISMASVANSADFSATPGTAINIDFAGDASGASGDVEGVANVTLTGWAAALTPGHVWIIRLARDGDATEDASTVASYSGPLVISYGITQ